MIRSIVFAAALVLAGLGSAAWADSGDGYQLVIIPGSPQQVELAVRENVATGESVMSINTGPYFAIGEPTPVPRGVYRLFEYHTFDSTAANRTYNFYRLDAQSGRFWSLAFDGKTASWKEIVATK